MKQGLLANHGFTLPPLSLHSLGLLILVLVLCHLLLKYLWRYITKGLSSLRDPPPPHLEKYCFGHGAIVMYTLSEVTFVMKIR